MLTIKDMVFNLDITALANLITKYLIYMVRGKGPMKNFMKMAILGSFNHMSMVIKRG